MSQNSSMTSSTFKFPLAISLQGVAREKFYEWVWDQFQSQGLLGVHEGTLLCEEAAEQGLETESWTVDSGEAPRERDWVGKQAAVTTEFYFASEAEAAHALEVLGKMTGIEAGSIEEQKPQDWDAEWKASFLKDAGGVRVPPFWRIIPPWVDRSTLSLEPGTQVIRINPGAGFGTGTHETTQLCLEALGSVSGLQGARALDFGSGSGILAVGLALLGASVDAVEIDPLAIDNALENAELNQVKDQIHYSQYLSDQNTDYPVITANILRPVLLEFAETLVRRLRPGGFLILSGLIESDLPSVIEAYSQLLGKPPRQTLQKAEWRALVWEKRR